MDFSDLLQRANLNAIETFFMYGGINLEKPSGKTYTQRLTETRKKAADFFAARFPDLGEYDEISEHFDELAAVYEEVYFEIGLILGAKIAFQISGKMEELSP